MIGGHRHFQRVKLVQRLWGLGFPIGFLAFALLLWPFCDPHVTEFPQLDPGASSGAAKKARQGHLQLEQISNISNREIEELTAVWWDWNLAERIMLLTSMNIRRFLSNLRVCPNSPFMQGWNPQKNIAFDRGFGACLLSKSLLVEADRCLRRVDTTK